MLVKHEPEDVLLPDSAPGLSGAAEPPTIPKTPNVTIGIERVRLVFDGLEVPTLALLEDRARKRRKVEKDGVKLALPGKLKIKKGPKSLPNIDLITINKRLEVLGPPGARDYDVDIDPEVKYAAVSRLFISDTWGGNCQETFPNIGKEHASRHNLRNWAFPNLLYNPAGPQIPGAAGLLFSPDGNDSGSGDGDLTEYRVIVRLPDGGWCYVGQYLLIPAPSLLHEEWMIQPERVKSTWAKEIARKSWGLTVRTRVALRKKLGKEPTRQQLKKGGNEGASVTPNDIRRAFDAGKETLGVMILKCIGYEEDFARQLCELSKVWVKPPPKNPKKKKNAATKTAPKTKEGLKRKREPSSESEQLVETYEDGEENDEWEDDEEAEEAEQDVRPRENANRRIITSVKQQGGR
ncbi:hypothetical protein FIBSPDRAFT_932337 [Athelia psychrophila]|uniref:DUF6697 domain-containing protein n=1 Tax=Athelia psychrophila TaxID=1759441 RepID=A0A166IXY8_9AGAM|nr:hypothetical protein FIBSPDRAFT_932337 [Fibularhizoctonia sp. CBS 109695]